MFDLLRQRRDRRRAERERRAFYGDCPGCRHDWRGHDSAEGCDDCLYDIGHEEPGAPVRPCRVLAPGFTFAGGEPSGPPADPDRAALPEWIVRRRPRAGRVTAGEWSGSALHVEPDDRDPEGWHLYLTGPGHAWDMWADDGAVLLEHLDDPDHGFHLDEERI